MSFKDIFNIDPEVKESAHARVNLIGEHTDYTGGYVLPSLLNFNTTIHISKNNIKKYQVYSENFNEKKEFNDFIKSKNNDWIDYVKGCLFVFYNENKHIPNTHLNIFITSTIPMGRGISSSSAFFPCSARALVIFCISSNCSSSSWAKSFKYCFLCFFTIF